MFEDQPLEGLHQMRAECYRPIAAEVLWLCGPHHWYHTEGCPQLWYFTQIQAHVEHVPYSWSAQHPDILLLVPHLC